MPRKKAAPDVDIPVIENGGKVLSTDGEAIDIPEAVKFDDTPVIPTTPPKKDAKKEKNINLDEIKKEIIPETTEKVVSKEVFEKNLIEIGCVLADKLLGERKNLNTNPLQDRQIASIECLLNIYKTIK